MTIQELKDILDELCKKGEGQYEIHVDLDKIYSIVEDVKIESDPGNRRRYVIL